jgi:hypothetical protein
MFNILQTAQKYDFNSIEENFPSILLIFEISSKQYVKFFDMRVFSKFQD